MSHDITKLNVEIRRLKTQVENLLSMVRNNSVVTATLRADLESLKAKGGGAQTGVLPVPSPESDKGVSSPVSGEVPK